MMGDVVWRPTSFAKGGPIGGLSNGGKSRSDRVSTISMVFKKSR